MPEPRAQRTLVKSPPEIWAEVSDVSTLARHLGEFGEIRITRLEAETTVVWEGDRARGTVELEASGWGTKVTITAEAIATDGAEVVEAEEKDAAPAEAVGPEEPAAVETEAIEPAVAEPEPIEAEAEVEVEVVDAEPVEAEVVETTATIEAEEAPAEPEPAAAAEPMSQELARAPRRGFFARLLRRRAAPAMTEPPAVETPQATEPEPVAAEPVAAEPEPFAIEPEPIAVDGEPVAIEPEIVPTVAAPEPEIPEAVEVTEAPEISEPVIEGEIAASAAAATAALEPEQVEAVLVGVLDDLGSAHHRPFSRG